jgi:hypothetical protein
MWLFQIRPVEYAQRILGDSRREPTQHCSPRTVIIFGMIATLAGLFFRGGPGSWATSTAPRRLFGVIT